MLKHFPCTRLLHPSHCTRHPKIHIVLFNYRSKRSCESYVFYSCLSGHRGDCLIAWWDTTPPPPGADPSGSRHPPKQTPPSREQTPPPADGYCCGRYASYWNAFFFFIFAVCHINDQVSINVLLDNTYNSNIYRDYMVKDNNGRLVRVARNSYWNLPLRTYDLN